MPVLFMFILGAYTYPLGSIYDNTDEDEFCHSVKLPNGITVAVPPDA